LTDFTLVDGVFTSIAVGNLYFEAVITDGIAPGRDYVHNFAIWFYGGATTPTPGGPRPTPPPDPTPTPTPDPTPTPPVHNPEPGFIPVSEITISLPTLVRTGRRIMLNDFVLVSPESATNRNITWEFINFEP
jgi:hypothetical protein